MYNLLQAGLAVYQHGLDGGQLCRPAGQPQPGQAIDNQHLRSLSYILHRLFHLFLSWTSDALVSISIGTMC